MKGKNISYSFDQKNKIVIANIEKPIDIEDIQLHYQILHNHFLKEEKLKVLIKAKNLAFKVLGSEIRASQKEIFEFIKPFKSLKEAIVTVDTYATAIAMIFEDLYQLPNYDFVVFSDEKTAFKWLKDLQKVT